jgi:hypothetical protein
LVHGGQADINDHLKSKKHQTNLKAAQSTASVLSFMPSQSAPTLKGPGEMIKIPVIFKKRPGFFERSSGSPALLQRFLAFTKILFKQSRQKSWITLYFEIFFKLF